MSSQIRDVVLRDPIKVFAPRVDARTLAARVKAAAAAALRELWAIMNAPENLRRELYRMADECESTRPEDAARLRQVASRNWSD